MDESFTFPKGNIAINNNNNKNEKKVENKVKQR